MQIIYPEEGAKYPFVTRSFTLGNAAPGSTMTINGVPIAVHREGGFLAMVDLATGPFLLRYEASLDGVTAGATRMIEVAQPHGLPSSKPDEAVAYEPSESLALLPGDLLAVRCKGPAGSIGTFRIEDLAKELPMAEHPSIPTVYEGHYYVQPGDEGEGLDISCALRTPKNHTLKAEAKGKLTVLDPRLSRVAVTTARSAVLKSAKSGYSLFLPPGVRLETAGRSGDTVRIKLSEHEESWANASDLRFLPEGTPPPHSEVGLSVSVGATPSSTKVVIRSSERVPFEVAHSIEPLRFEVRFFGASHHVDRIRYRPDDPVVKDVRWRQEDSRVVRFSVDTELWWGWGYDATYDERGNFVLDIRRPPDLTKGDVLRGRRIVLDPGHGPGTSAVGPLGTTERDVNLAIGLQLRDLLVKEGAEVFLTRISSDGPPLGDRPFLAWEAKGDLYLSLHNNALPMTADPFEGQHGYMNFFYQPHSRPFAAAMHASYNKERKELPDEGLWWGNLAVCRVPQMPAVLTESAYMIFPEQEVRLRAPAYQKEVAQTLLEGIRSFYESYRKLQLRRKPERRAARAK
ncbi:MAG TPA: hypothetical protein DD417_10315 [Elusimicrobia bacterium]|nr:hypothetical protein [Elusimicrobiota bacterium]